MARRPSVSAIGGSTRHPSIVPAESSIVPYDARRAASCAAYPSRRAICVTDAGTYTEPAHSPMIETKRYTEFSTVRRLYMGENSFRNAAVIVGRLLWSSTRACQRADSCTP